MKMRAPMRLGYDNEPNNDRPPRMVNADAYSAFVPVIERAARRAWREADRCKRALLFTDYEFAVNDARTLENLAHHFDPRGGR